MSTDDGAGPLQLGLLLPTGEGPNMGFEGRGGRWPELREAAELAEAMGFDTLWVADHLLYRSSPPETVIPEGETRGIWECWTMVSALAAATRRATLGPFVACAQFRNPALLAKMADSVDEISGGRLLLGLGAGWHPPEFAAFGYPSDHRVGRFEEALQIIVPLLRDGRVDFHGAYYRARECELRPRGPRPTGPPIWIAGERPRMLRLAARYGDAYNTGWYTEAAPAGVRFAQLADACAEVGRDPGQVQRTASIMVTVDGFQARPVSPFAQAMEGTPEELATKIREFRSVGVRHVSYWLRPFTMRHLEALGRTIEIIRQLDRGL
jgi:probable F420-dependent oxidoreductase